jgi:hypothetical protein
VTAGPRIEVDEFVQPLALNETAGVAGKENKLRMTPKFSRGRPRAMAVAHAVEINGAE